MTSGTLLTLLVDSILQQLIIVIYRKVEYIMQETVFCRSEQLDNDEGKSLFHSKKIYVADTSGTQKTELYYKNNKSQHKLS